MSTELGKAPTSYDLVNTVRDLSDEFTTILARGGGLISLIGEEEREFFGEDGKLQWLEDIEVSESDILDNGGSVSSADTEFGVSHPERFSQNMIIKFRDYDE